MFGVCIDSNSSKKLHFKPHCGTFQVMPTRLFLVVNNQNKNFKVIECFETLLFGSLLDKVKWQHQTWSRYLIFNQVG